MRRLSHGAPFRPLRRAVRPRLPRHPRVVPVDAPLAHRQELRDAPHDDVRREALGGSTVRAGRQLVGEAERATDAHRDPAARMRQLLAPRPDPVRAADPDGHDRGAGAERQHGDAVAGRLERTVGAARALREDEQDVALVEDAARQPEGLDIGRAAIDRVDAAVRAIQPTTGQSKSSFLPSQWIRRPSVGVSQAPRTTGSKFDAWFEAMITGPSRGISSIAPSIRMRDIARAKIRAPKATVRMSGVVALSIGSGAGASPSAAVGAVMGASSVTGAPRRRGSRWSRPPRCPRSGCRRSR